MAKVGAQRAAELTGKSKSTIQRAMNSGKLSYEVDVNKRRIIDVSELERVFGLKSSDQTTTASTSVQQELEKATQMIEMERMKMRIKMLEEQLEIANSTIDDMKSQRDQWQKQAQQVLLTSQYSQKQAEDYKAELKTREEKARKRREQILAEKMKRMEGQNENSANSSSKESHSDNEKSTSLDMKSLWQKIRGDKENSQQAKKAA